MTHFIAYIYRTEVETQDHDFSWTFLSSTFSEVENSEDESIMKTFFHPCRCCLPYFEKLEQFLHSSDFPKTCLRKFSLIYLLNISPLESTICVLSVGFSLGKLLPNPLCSQ